MIKDPVTVTKGLSNKAMLDAILRQVKGTRKTWSYKVVKIIVVDEQNRVDDIISFFDLW